MNNFEEIQHRWKNQPQAETTDHAFNSLLKNVKAIEGKQKITNGVLIATLLVVLAFVLYVSAYKNETFVVGTSIMMISLLVRIALEMLSIRRLKKMNFVKSSTRFKEEIIRYYQNRKGVHFIATPLCIAAYTIGFTMLLPLFKASLSYGFYLYILISSIVLLCFFSIFIFKHIQKELAKLKQLQTIGQ